MPDPYMIDNDRSTDLSARRTGLSFQRTRMAADRTMLSVLRTSLSLISFGFTIYKVMESVSDKPNNAARNFGLTLIGIGIAALIGGIVYELRFMAELRHQREALELQGSIHAESQFPRSFNLALAILLLLVGIFAVLSILYRLGPFI